MAAMVKEGVPLLHPERRVRLYGKLAETFRRVDADGALDAALDHQRDAQEELNDCVCGKVNLDEDAYAKERREQGLKMHPPSCPVGRRERWRRR